jgi:hypothetical protein
LDASVGEKLVTIDEQWLDPLAHQKEERFFDFADTAGLEDVNRQPDRAGARTMRRAGRAPGDNIRPPPRGPWQQRTNVWREATSPAPQNSRHFLLSY